MFNLLYSPTLTPIHDYWKNHILASRTWIVSLLLCSNMLYFCCCCYLVTKSYLTFCNPMDCNLPASSVHGILQARILECVAISSFRASSQLRGWTCISCTGRRVLYHWATREVQYALYTSQLQHFSSYCLLLFALCSLFLSRIPLHSRNKSYSMLYFLPPALTKMVDTEDLENILNW